MEQELQEYFTSLSDLEEVNVDLIAEIVKNIVDKRGEITRAELEYTMDKSRVIMTKNMALMNVQNNFKENLKNKQISSVPPVSPPKRTATSSPAKSKKK